ncbi:hypothetical protein DFH29DRAFT_1005373 [Suillus ampliporus]|nr:hypothetical protein DFH29DRAFT_1005373 [Suillus ampliporus]
MKHALPLQIRQGLHQTGPFAGPGFIPAREHSPTPAGDNPGINGHFYDDVADQQQDLGFVPVDGTWVDMGCLFHTFHPHMTGLKCDTNGTFIDQDAPPPPHMDAPPTDWTPYSNWVKFETAKILFMCKRSK